MKTKYIFAFLLVLTMVGCKGEQPSTGGSPPPEKEGTEIARVDNRVITLEDYQKEVANLPAYAKSMVASYEKRIEFLNNLSDRELLLEEANRKGIPQDPAIQKKIKELETKLVVEKLLKNIVESKGTIDDAEIKSYFEEHQGEFHRPEQIRASHILIKVDENADTKTDQEARAKAEKLLKELRAGGDFSELAKQYSEGPTNVKGGDLGYFARGKMVKEFDEVAFALEKEGEVSDIVKTKFGYHIITLTGKKEEQTRTLEQVKPQIQRKLQNMKRKELFEAFIKNLRDNATITKKPELLKEMEGAEPPAQPQETK